ncbi:hypothetical protein [Clostridium perfringens]|uniref:hypothetical protein n=1 Tax=Clostridium perfringens TaxID=1502 RepID=UPI0024BCE930|nr:hypothetical protein [Clostridium perfringens]
MMYELCKMQIKNGNCDKKDMMECIGLFRITGQLTNDQYMELFNMLNPVKVVVTPTETTPIQA